MKHLRAVKNERSALVGLGVRVLVLNDGSDQGVRERLAGLGGTIDCETEMFTALSMMMDDPRGYGLFVMETDRFGGIEAGLRAVKLLRAAEVRLPIVLVSVDCPNQIFPQERSAPIILKAPLSMVSLRVGFEHALHERAFWRAA